MSENTFFQEEDRNSGPNPEIRRIRGVLKEITGYAEHASLTGAMKGGTRQAVRQYNAIVGHLRETNTIPPYLLVELEEDASTDEVGVAARMLSGYLRADEEPSHGQHGRHGHHPPHPPHPPQPPFGLADLPNIEEMKEIGQRVRVQLEQLPDWIKGRIEEGKREGRPERDIALREMETRLDQIGTELADVTRQLREGDLTEEQRAELAGRLSELSREQARLEVQRDTLRETRG